ncbi:MAG: hypothetical protein JNL08_17455 [Planctomycetes bacterium]|nr:hypothetical protein [Planctomycetota bacterium]
MLKPNFRPDDRVLRQFAVFAIVGLPLLALLVLRLFGAFTWNHPAFLAAAGVGVVQAVTFFAGLRAPTTWLFVGLTVVALPIGFVLSHVLMALIYYGVMTPIGLVFRLMGRDVIGRRPDRARPSFWHDRGPARRPASYFKLY